MNMQEMSKKLLENDAKIAQLLALQKMQSRSDADAGSFADIQSRADEALSRHGKRAGSPMLGESSLGYRKRMATQVAAFSPAWAAMPMGGVNDAAFERLESAIYADCAAAPIAIPEGELVCVPKPSYGGHKICEYHGSPGVWMSQFAGPVRQYVKSFNTKAA